MERTRRAEILNTNRLARCAYSLLKEVYRPFSRVSQGRSREPSRVDPADTANRSPASRVMSLRKVSILLIVDEFCVVYSPGREVGGLPSGKNKMQGPKIDSANQRPRSLPPKSVLKRATSTSPLPSSHLSETFQMKHVSLSQAARCDRTMQ